LARGHEAQTRSWCSAGRRKKHEGARGEDREKREAKQVSRETNNWSVRGSLGGAEEGKRIRGGEQHGRFFGNICGERKKSSGEREMVCGGRREGWRMEIEAVVVWWSSDFFFYGGSGGGDCGFGSWLVTCGFRTGKRRGGRKARGEQASDVTCLGNLMYAVGPAICSIVRLTEMSYFYSWDAIFSSGTCES
jgi:hypothetical protein